MTRQLAEHVLRRNDDHWRVLTVAGRGPLSVDAKTLAELRSPKTPAAPDDELLEEIDRRPDTRLVVMDGLDLGLRIDPTPSGVVDEEIGAAYVRWLLPTLTELARRGVQLVLFAGWELRELDAVRRGREIVLEQLAGTPDAEAQHKALSSIPVWSSSGLERVLSTKLPALIPGLRVQRRRPATVPPAGSRAALELTRAVVRARSSNQAHNERPASSWTTTCGALHLSYWTAEPTPADIGRLHEEVRVLARVESDRVAMMLVVAPRAGLSPAAARASVASTVGELGELLDGIAVVFPGSDLWPSTLRGMFQGIGSITREKTRSSAFSRSAAAIAWLADAQDGRADRFDPSAALEALERLRSRAGDLR